MNKSIIVLGASGAVGMACVQVLLEHHIPVIAVCRHPEKMLEVAPVWAKDPLLMLYAMDILLADTWPNELASSACVINCAGPSSMITPHLMALLLASSSQERMFVDVGGDQAMIDQWQTDFQSVGWRGVLGAGVQPGLVGVAVRALASRCPVPSSLDITVFIGGLQRMTPAGLAEYLQAVTDRTGFPGKYWQQGAWLPVVQHPSVPPCFSSSAITHAYVDEENQCAAKDFELKKLQSFNVSDSLAIAHVLNELMVTGGTITKACQRIDACLVGKQPYFCIHVSGRDASGCTYSSTLQCTDSYALSGATAAWAAISFCQHTERAGIYWFSQSPHAQALWLQWEKAPITACTISRQDYSEPFGYEAGEL